MDVMAINPEHVCIKILDIKNSHQNITNNVKSNHFALTSEQNTVSIKPNVSGFLHSYLADVYITIKNANNPLEQNNLANLTAANNQLHYADNDIVKFTNQNDGVKVEPTYAARYESVEKQQYASNDVYYDAEGYSIVGQEKHIYEKISDYALEEGEQIDNKIYYDAFRKNEEHIYETISDYVLEKREKMENETYYDGFGKIKSLSYKCQKKSARMRHRYFFRTQYGVIKIKSLSYIYETISDYVSDKTSSYLNSNKETNVENGLTSLEKSVAINMVRNEITRFAEQTFALAKSFISRLPSSIWNAVSGSKNESKIVPPAELVACAMRENITEICDRFNECIEKKIISGAFRQQPGSEYSLTDNKKLVHTFNKYSRQHDHIELSFLIKAYIGSNFPKIELSELTNIGFSTNKFNQLLDKNWQTSC
ncbi:hypothetical protein [Arsenophonus endosymbiont of Bemisia tabaci]|uniref:hypothetical protein n=1 Tax=Arsenophonus endosymbiont of Bemisia tabaci TaxID=536059 RepID=UPI0015F64F8F|nr:hypothetical protein [Arsenophonus endosymbiont of Bemisia tabaci]